MEIYWLGHNCFRLRGRDATVLTDPCPPATGYRIGKVNANIVTVSNKRPENDFRSAAAEATVVAAPGEYEIAGALIAAVRTHDRSRPDAERNIACIIDLDDIRICHLGDISQVPSRDDVEELSAPDVLMIPVGGGNVLDAAKAAETVSLLEPKIVIPMQYKTEASTAELDAVDRFLREMGAEAKTPEQRLTITRSSGIPSDTTVVLLSYRG
jgi:L-ascorbate metabolism protein UlaG (beta-lactamase superfamily)